MRKNLAIAAAVVIAGLLTAGGSVYTGQGVFGGSSCHKPVVLLESAQADAVKATDEYVDLHIAELYEHPKSVNWITAAVRSVGPAKIDATIALGETTAGFLGYEFSEEPRLYHVILERACSGDDWKVVEFELVKGQQPEPNAGQAPKPAVSA